MQASDTTAMATNWMQVAETGELGGHVLYFQIKTPGGRT